MHLLLVFVLALPCLSSPIQDDEIKALRAQIAKLKSENRKLAKMIEDAEFNGYHFNERAVRNFLPAFKSLPKELQPQKGLTWDKKDQEMVLEHLQKVLVGKPFESKFLVKSCKPDFDKRSDKIKVALEVEEISFSMNGFTFSQTLKFSNTGFGKNKFEFEISTKEAKALKNLKPRKFAVISGQIKSVNFDRGHANRTIFSLKNIQVNGLVKR